MKIRVRTNKIEIDFDGDEAFLKNDLEGLLRMLDAMYPVNSDGGVTGVANEATGGVIADAESQFEGSINTIAAKLNVKSGPELVMAAMAHHVFVQHIETVTRAELSAEMKNATAYFKPSYLSNLTQHLNGLVKAGQLNEMSKDTYALPAEARKTLLASLSGKTED